MCVSFFQSSLGIGRLVSINLTQNLNLVQGLNNIDLKSGPKLLGFKSAPVTRRSSFRMW